MTVLLIQSKPRTLIGLWPIRSPNVVTSLTNRRILRGQETPRRRLRAKTHCWRCQFSLLKVPWRCFRFSFLWRRTSILTSQIDAMPSRKLRLSRTQIKPLLIHVAKTSRTVRRFRFSRETRFWFRSCCRPEQCRTMRAPKPG